MLKAPKQVCLFTTAKQKVHLLCRLILGCLKWINVQSIALNLIFLGDERLLFANAVLQLQMKDNKQSIFQIGFTFYAVKALLLFCFTDINNRRDLAQGSSLLNALFGLQYKWHANLEDHLCIKLLVRIRLSDHSGMEFIILKLILSQLLQFSN